MLLNLPLHTARAVPSRHLHTLHLPLTYSTFALHCAAPSDYIKLQGDWKSNNAHERYVDHSLRYKLVTVNQMCKDITH